VIDTKDSFGDDDQVCSPEQTSRLGERPARQFVRITSVEGKSMFADMVFPYGTGAYISNIFVPVSAILALATEFVVYVYFQRGLISPTRLFGIVLGVNIFSWLAGLFITLSVPDGFIPRLPDADGLVDLGWACFLSTVFEYFPLWIFRKRLAFRKLALCVIIANVAGYIVIWVTVWVFMHSPWLNAHLAF
jgi:hypothetical protein